MSLLARFFNQIKSSQEDIASESLSYILQNSDFAKNEFNKRIHHITKIELPELSYETQITETGLGRTDISGFDSKRNEMVIIEAKFWASLTEHQPISYLKRQKSNSVLVFICPSKRKSSLSVELIKKLNENNIEFKRIDDSNSLELSNKQFILIQSWKEILDSLKYELEKNHEQGLVSDIDQIIGFCNVIDENSFIPLNDKDLSPEIGKVISSYYELTNEVIDELIKHTKEYSTKGLTEGKPKDNTFGYYKYRRYYGYIITFGLNYGYWSKFADTPFWIRISEEDKWIQNSELKLKLKSVSFKILKQTFEVENSDLYFPIYPAKYEDKNNVVKNMVQQINEIFDQLREL